jgi:adenosine 3'-phospho 5'-phosphosulfate transporter B3
MSSSKQEQLLPTHVESKNKNPHAERNKFLICVLGVFSTYLVYGYLQELIFTLDGISGWYLTLVQFFYYTIFGIVSNKQDLNNRRIPIRIYILLAFLTLGTMSLSNASLGYLNYPTQVIFKCCKLIPVLIGSILIQKKKHTLLDFLAAGCMVGP